MGEHHDGPRKKIQSEVVVLEHQNIYYALIIFDFNRERLQLLRRLSNCRDTEKHFEADLDFIASEQLGRGQWHNNVGSSQNFLRD